MSTIEEYRKCFKKLKKAKGEEKEDLEYELSQITCRIAIIPKCCKKSQTHPIIYLGYDKEECDLDDPSGKERVRWKSKIFDQFSNSKDWWRYIPSPKFCPYCGAKLPTPRKLTKKEIKDIGLPIHNQTDYYCATCEKRNQVCNCLPPWVKWTIDE